LHRGTFVVTYLKTVWCVSNLNGGRIILRWIFKNGMTGCDLDKYGSGYGPLVDSCGHDNELSGSIKCGKFADPLRDYEVLKKDSAPWI
jgi:hypothetical protein